MHPPRVRRENENSSHRTQLGTRGDSKAVSARWPIQTGTHMNRRVLTILLLAFVIAGGCAFVVYHLVVNRMTASKTVATTRVGAAATDIKLGAVLNSADLATVEIAGPLPKGAILEKDKGNAIGRGVLEDMY